jgi:hypothetical protein
MVIELEQRSLRLKMGISALGRLLPVSRPAVNDGNQPEPAFHICLRPSSFLPIAATRKPKASKASYIRPYIHSINKKAPACGRG